MTWKIDDPQGNEAAKIRWEIVPYTRGRGLDVGCGGTKAFPHFIGCDNGTDIKLFGHQFKPDVWIEDAGNLSLFASNSMDFVFSSHCLEHIPPEKVPDTLREWLRVIKVDGYLVLYLPDETLYPKVGEPGANPDHRWNVSYTAMVEYMKRAGSWDLVDWQRRDQGQEYSLFMVFKKRQQGHKFSCSNPKPSKTAAIVRYGAFGDLLQMSSVAAGLKKQGYHVTLFTATPHHEILSHDPNIDHFFLQDKDQVPNHLLGEFWACHKPKYDKWVQLSESVEGTLLAMPGRAVHELPPAVRHSMMNRNYLEFQHEIAGVPHEPVVRFYETQEEVAWAKKERKDMSFVLVWSLSGSSIHKTWPWVDNVVHGLLKEFPSLHVVFVGGEAGVLLEQGWFAVKEDGMPKRGNDGKRISTIPRVHCRSGDWTMRQTLAFVNQADMVVGPETGVLNAASHLPIPKVIFLSHSTNENLTRDWENAHVLVSENTVCPGRGNNDAPACHQLHFGWTHCKRGTRETAAEGESVIAQCQEDISLEHAFRVLWHVVTWAFDTRKEKTA